MTEHKAVTSFQLKDDATGEFSAAIATLGVVDRDGDIIRPGALKEGAKVTVSSYGHSAVFGSRPAGRGTLHVIGNKVVANGRLFLTTFDGKETHALLREMGDMQEWSFGYHPVGTDFPTEAERKAGAERILTDLHSFEVSPVLLGAGIGTQTLGVKAGAVTAAEVAAEAQRFKLLSQRRLGRALHEARPDWVAAAKFACKACGLSESERPDFRVVSDAELRGLMGPVPPGQRPFGCYADGTVYVADTLTGDDALGTVAHEVLHHYERRKGWGVDERFVEAETRRVLAEYHAHAMRAATAPTDTGSTEEAWQWLGQGFRL